MHMYLLCVALCISVCRDLIEYWSACFHTSLLLSSDTQAGQRCFSRVLHSCLYSAFAISTLLVHVKVPKNGQQKTCSLSCNWTLLQNEMKSDLVRFITHIKPVLQQIRLLTGLNEGGKTRNIAIQLVLQQYCKTCCTFFVGRFSIP